MVVRHRSGFDRFNPLCRCVDGSLLATMVRVARATRDQNAISHRCDANFHRTLFV